MSHVSGNCTGSRAWTQVFFHDGSHMGSNVEWKAVSIALPIAIHAPKFSSATVVTKAVMPNGKLCQSHAGRCISNFMCCMKSGVDHCAGHYQ